VSFFNNCECFYVDGGAFISKICSLVMLIRFDVSIFFRAFVPAVLLGEAEPKVNEQSAKSQEQHTVRIINSELLSNTLVIF
jgi:hypothetical protein